ncbi:MAG: hypothetical protein ACXAC8_03420 [Candidatus Hodarchaeales archaeon]|jgi:hypothetical protein
MNPKLPKIFSRIHIRSSPVEKSTRGSFIYIPTVNKSLDLTDNHRIMLIAKSIDDWDGRWEVSKCMICWKPLQMLGENADMIMECPHCNRKGHQGHVLKWLAKKHHCPVCQGKW